MLKRFITIFLMTLAVSTYAQMNIECVGKATQVVNKNDTLFFFASQIELRSKIGKANWYSTQTGTLVQSEAEYFYPDEGGYYIVKGGVEYSPFYVFVCRTEELTMTVETACDQTLLNLSGDATPYTYIRRNGTKGTYERMCTIDYNALAWNTEQWADSAAQVTLALAPTLRLPALYGKTPVKLCCDAELRDALELAPECITVEVPEEDIRAVKLNLTKLAAARENDPDGNNELERPTEQDFNTSMSYSGAMEVAFYSNPTPAVQFYQWTIYKATERIATRTDKDIRYIFSEPGSYRVVCTVNNSYCVADSSEIQVNISESYLAVPNFFSPGGSCRNSEFRVAYRSLREFHCWVYNRWGKLVYEWTDPSKGWDGTINGQLAADGAYFYVIRALGTDAGKYAQYTSKASYQKKKLNADESVIGVYQLSGDINLIRCRK